MQPPSTPMSLCSRTYAGVYHCQQYSSGLLHMQDTDVRKARGCVTFTAPANLTALQNVVHRANQLVRHAYRDSIWGEPDIQAAGDASYG